MAHKSHVPPRYVCRSSRPPTSSVSDPRPRCQRSCSHRYARPSPFPLPPPPPPPPSFLLTCPPTSKLTLPDVGLPLPAPGPPRARFPDNVTVKAPALMAIGCFCIGTDTTDLAEAAQLGVSETILFPALRLAGAPTCTMCRCAPVLPAPYHASPPWCRGHASVDTSPPSPSPAPPASSSGRRFRTLCAGSRL